MHAYLGQAGNIKNPAYLLAAASIVTVEARHSGAIGLLPRQGDCPDPVRHGSDRSDRC